ncbi:aldo/keto reductase [Fulvivirgaceae bacterium BMA10]|uniref:Aldo/keto reductase n=1 Tax=Splendidivirga corallicola TaxID=3051826 RepID=A0ABT8KI15_9BACT|nr:aldo/keto reductase [Fulvivirgaceae bacterium BMA10]
MNASNISRRQILKLMGFASASQLLGKPLEFLSENNKMMQRKIKSSGELLPVVGVGTWLTFDVGSNASDRATLKEVLKLMHQHGGKLIDSSPMYGSSEEVVGGLTKEIGLQNEFFYATKVWTTGESDGINQMRASLDKLKRSKMDLMQIHNLIDWRTHIKTLRRWKEEGKIRYIGITHYTDASHDRLKNIIEREKIDFVQFNYSIRKRNAERGLLDAALKHNVAVIVNRPYEGGSLFRLVKGRALPDWVKEYDINSWGQYFLKFLLAHPAVNCVIPGTSKPHHLVDNMKAGYGKLPNQEIREKMYSHIRDLR